MTREEIIQGLQFTIDMFLFDPLTGEPITKPRNDMDKTTIDACKGAIELLEQQPCEDTISRQAVLDKIKEVCFSKEKEWVDFRVSYGSRGQRDLIINFIEDSPSIQPKPKTGRWIYDYVSADGHRVYHCSECGCYLKPKHSEPLNSFKWCSSCGARMIELQESEKALE